jgi:carboxymethylenebutenolidase
MCDPLTESENAAFLTKALLNRRQVSAFGAAGVAMAAMPGCASVATTTDGATPPTMEGSQVAITLPDGVCDAYFVRPSGKAPAVIIWPDVAGLRDAYYEMATTLAGHGYAVLVVNPYYRNAKAPVLNTFAEWRTDEGQAKIAPMRAALMPDAITRDATGLVAWLDQQPQVDTSKKIAAIGYCMGGPFTFRTAYAAKDRVGAIASFHGGGLATNGMDSPHWLIEHFKAAMLIAIAQNDDERDPEAKEILRQSAEASGRFAEIEVYPAQHGWCTIDSPVYDEVQATRTFDRMIALFKANL